jgi:hypothetical protein
MTNRPTYVTLIRALTDLRDMCELVDDRVARDLGDLRGKLIRLHDDALMRGKA